MLYSLSQKRDNDCFEHLQSRENFAIVHCKARLFKTGIDPQWAKIVEKYPNKIETFYPKKLKLIDMFSM